MRAVSGLHRSNDRGRAAPQSLPALPPLASRRQGAARRSGERLPGLDGPDRALRPPRRRVGDRPPLPRLRPGATQPPRRRRQSGVADPFAAGRAPDRAGTGGWHGIRRGYHDARYATGAPQAVARGVLTGRDRARGGGPLGPPLHGLVRSPWRLSQAAAATVVPRADVKKRSRRSAYSAAQHDQREACPRPGRTQSSFGSLAAS